AGKPYRVKLSYRHGDNGLYADGNDMVLVDVEVLDREGRRCPTATHMIDFSWDGPMDWRGGIAQGPNNYILSESLPVEGGVNRVMLRTQFGKSGKMKIKAQANGLLADSLSWEVLPVSEKNGFFVKNSSIGLPLNLDRGAGVQGEPLKQRRVTLPIQKVRAGANQAKVKSSYDDNELTDWVNDGTLQNAWIEYTLEKKSAIDEIDLKLNNFRSRSYPLQVFVDDKLVFDGRTQTTLGYYTLEIPRTEGRRVKIQLKGSSVVTSENQHAEVGGQKLDDGVKRDDANAKGTLSIIEIDIHKKTEP
ncbi:MAG TPA: beta-galactosidase, partial [Sphingobacterium sp.]|nr:beta-galactosidase [Sphingobacterium sp.]